MDRDIEVILLLMVTLEKRINLIKGKLLLMMDDSEKIERELFGTGEVK